MDSGGFNQVRTLIFDYDGTLHDSMKIYAPSFRSAYQLLVEKGAAPERIWKDGEISKWLGYAPQAMWDALLPDVDPAMKREASLWVGKEMLRRIEAGEAALYEGAVETLAYLKGKGYALVFLSNCKTYYKEAHRRMFHLDRFFDTLICAEEYGFIEKHAIVAQLRSGWQEELLVIGDRHHDLAIGTKNGLRTIGCRYGFGSKSELETATVCIDDIRELCAIL